jgi:hypothetical protein
LANTTSVTRRWTIEEYTQTGTLSHDASGAGNTTTSATTLATDGVTTATDDELLAGGIQRSDGSSANTGASGTTVIRNVATGKTASGYKVIATAAAGQVLNFSWTTNDVAGCCASAFKATAAAGRTTKNTRAWPLGTEIGMNWRVPC